MELRIGITLFTLLHFTCAIPRNPVNKLEPFEEDCLESHNTYRAEHGVPPLTWSADLAARAQNWADHLASNDELKHDDEAMNNDNEGENLAFFRPAVPKCQGFLVGNCVLCREMVKRWYDEEKQYNFDTGTPKMPNSITKHFTQLIWANTSEFGIGTAVSKKYGFITVAKYRPQGNKGGEEAYVHNVPPEGGPLPPEAASKQASSSTPTGLGVPSEDSESQNSTVKADAPKSSPTSSPTGLGVPTSKSSESADALLGSPSSSVTGLGMPVQPSESVRKISPLVMMPKLVIESKKGKTKVSMSKLNNVTKRIGKELKSIAHLLASRKHAKHTHGHGKKGPEEGGELENHEANKDFSYENSDSSKMNAIIGWKKGLIGEKGDKVRAPNVRGSTRDYNQGTNGHEDRNEGVNNGPGMQGASLTDSNIGLMGASNLPSNGIVRTLKGPDGTDAQLYLTKNGAHAGIVFRNQISRVGSETEASEGSSHQNTETPTKRTIYVL